MAKGKPGVTRTPSGEVAMLREYNKPDYTHEDTIVIFQLMGDAPYARRMYETLLASANMGLVVHIAKERGFQRRGLTSGELMNAGVVGLMKAIEDFDWRRGNRFGTYAAYWIRQSINRACKGEAFEGRPMRVPASADTQSREIEYERNKLKKLLGREPLDEEIAEQFRDPSKKRHNKEQGRRRVLAARLRQKTRSVALNGPIDQHDEGSRKTQDHIADDRIVPHDLVLAARQLIDRCLASLTNERSRELFHRHYGLGQDVENFSVIGKSWGLTRTRIQQLSKKIDERLAALYDVTPADIRQAIVVLGNRS